MNTRCYRCGWSFSLSRDTIGAAVTNAAEGETYHVENCPKCKQAIKIPLDQLKRALPPDWKPETPPEEAPGEPAAPIAPVLKPEEEKEPAKPETKHKHRPRHHL